MEIKIDCELFITQEYFEIIKVIASGFCTELTTKEEGRVFAIYNVGNRRSLLEKSGKFITEQEYKDMKDLYDFY